MKKIGLTIGALLLTTNASGAVFVGAGLNSSPVGSGSYGTFGWELPSQSEVVAGLVGKFSILRINNYAIEEDNKFKNTLSDKAELGVSLGRRVQDYQPYVSVGAVYLQPDKALAPHNSWGGFGALGLKVNIDEQFSFQIDQTVNFGLEPATGVPRAPNIFNVGTTSLGFAMKV